MCVLKFLWNEAALIIFMANHLFHPGLGFVLWLIGSVPGAAAVQLGFSTSGLRVNKYLLVREKKEGAVDPVSFKICSYHLPGLQIKVVLPHQKLFMNQGA